MSISFFDDLGGLFFCISVTFHCSDHWANHQKLNVIQNSISFFLAGEGWQMGFESIYPYPFEIEIHQFPVQA